MSAFHPPPVRRSIAVVLAALALATGLLASGCLGPSSVPAQIVVGTNGVFPAVAD